MMRDAFPNSLLWKVLTLLPLAATGYEFYVDTMTTFLSDSYDALEESRTHTKSLKLNRYPVYSVTFFCAVILVDSEHLESFRAFKTDPLWYIA